MNWHRTLAAIGVATATTCLAIGQQRPLPVDLTKGQLFPVSKDLGSEKLGPSLSILLDAATKRSGGRMEAAKWRSVCSEFGIDPRANDPEVHLLVQMKPGTLESSIEALNAKIDWKGTEQWGVTIALSSVEDLTQVKGVRTVDIPKSREIPVGRKTTRGAKPVEKGTDIAKSGEADLDWDRHNLTGKGAIVSVIDTGIDFRHPDFLNADGTTRLLYLYDMSDDSYARTNHAVGSEPPLTSGGKPLGTLYTRAQLNAALKGTGVVNSVDKVGHGTACTGIAAGGKPGSKDSLATGSDIIFVKGMVATEDGSEYFSSRTSEAADWVKRQARALSRPVVISMSFGSMFSAHDGSDADEKLIDEIAAPSEKGVAVCISAGNDGSRSCHASSRFGPAKSNQLDSMGDGRQVLVTDSDLGTVIGLYDQRDDWGIEIYPTSDVYYDDSGDPVPVYWYMYKKGADYLWDVKRASGTGAVPDAVRKDVEKHLQVQKFGTSDMVVVDLPQGNFYVYPFGSGATVKSGECHMYGFDAVFGEGSSNSYIVASPGCATNAITVGSYVVRNTWNSLGAPNVTLNLPLGSLSTYSSAGPRIDGVMKPDLVAPGQFAVSSYAQGSIMGAAGAEGELDKVHITPDSQRIAWAGTSASAPYVAGVIALLFEKNPGLTSGQIKEILRKTCHSDGQTGPTPNPSWGYGKLDPGKAIEATPGS